MSTLPRANKSPSTSTFLTRPHSEFDAGINTSTAWTEHLERGSLSDEEPDEDGEPQESEGRAARALYQFEGKAEFRELNVEAGDAVEVMKEELADGWSLVRNAAGEFGLLPRSYYTFTSDFTPAPDLEIPTFNGNVRHKEASTNSDITPRGSPRHSTATTTATTTTTTQQQLPLVPQNTGEWRNAFPSFRQSLLGGKSLNRFSSFVTSGAEEWVLKGSVADEIAPPPMTVRHEKEDTSASVDQEESGKVGRVGMGEAERHYVDAGPAWKAKLPPFRALVHSPSKRTSSLSGAFTIYSVTSLFQPPSISESSPFPNHSYPTTPSPTRVTVQRRFSHFVILHTALTRRLPGIALPPLPEKQYAGRFSNDFVEARRGDLERYINRVVRHPVARYAEIVTFFLGCDSDTEWKRMIPQHLALPPAGPSFYAKVFHPAFNLDAEDAAESVDRFESHTRAVGKGVQGLRNIFGRVREARIEMSKAERLLSYSLLSLITSKPLASAPMTGASEEDVGCSGKAKGLLNQQGAWCWREDCDDCLKLTKAMQKTAETLQSVADLYDDQARRTELVTHESLKAVAHPSSLYEPVIDTHRSTLSRYHESISEGGTDEEMAARCETVLNTTMAEMETYHTQKIEDFKSLTTEHLDGEIVFYEQILNKLRTARRAYEPPQFEQLANTPRQTSIYERELENPRLTSKPLPQPCPHVFDSAPMRPVSVAIQEGVGMLLGSGASTRASVFSKFW